MESKKFSVKFVVATNEEHGITGAMPKRLVNVGWDSYLPNWQPSHDLMEHGKDEFGALYQELQALGAILHQRGWEVDEGFYAGNCRSDFTASDMMSSFRDAQFEEHLLNFPAFPKFSLSWEVKGRFREFFERLKPLVAKYWRTEIDDDCEDDCELCTENFFIKNWEQTKTAIMYGYYKSEKRWGDLNVHGLKNQIDQAMLNAEKTAMEQNEYNPYFEFSLRCEVSHYGASAEVVFPYGM